MASPADDRVTLFQVAASNEHDCKQALAAADRAWRSLCWADEALGYRKWVVKNFSRLLHYFREECLREIREQIPKTYLEAQKDFWEAKRCADHLEGAIEVGLRGEIVPAMIPGQTYWRDQSLPAGPATVITPMNFIYGIPGIQIVGAYLSGCPFIFKGHPFAAVTNDTLAKMLLAAGADPKPSSRRSRALAAGSRAWPPTARWSRWSRSPARPRPRARSSKDAGLRRLRFKEGGGCNWAYVDDGYSDEELRPHRHAAHVRQAWFR